MTSIGGEFASGALPKSMLLGFALLLASTGGATAQAVAPAALAAEAAAPPCTARGDYLLTVTNPPPVDRQLIMDLIHRFYWAVDERQAVGRDDMFLDGVTYELCNGADQQLLVTQDKQDLGVNLDAYGSAAKDGMYRTRHIESNTLLNAVDVDTVQGKTSVLVTIQYSSIETPVLDYTATLRSTFRRDGNLWKFAKMVLVTDGAQVRLRAR
jgi:hypothetical protein